MGLGEEDASLGKHQPASEASSLERCRSSKVPSRERRFGELSRSSLDLLATKQRPTERFAVLRGAGTRFCGAKADTLAAYFARRTETRVPVVETSRNQRKPEASVLMWRSSRVTPVNHTKSVENQRKPEA